MSEWLSYSLNDFLLYSPRTYWRMIDAYNLSLWPAHLLSSVLGAALLAFAWKTRGWQSLAICLMLAAAWGFVGWHFLWMHYAAISWIAPIFAVCFLGQAGMLVVFGAQLATSPPPSHRRRSGSVGIVVVCFGLAIQPFLPLFFGRALSVSDVFGIMPDGTAIVTIGLVLMLQRGVFGLINLMVPICWLTFSGLRFLAFPDPQGWLLIAAAAILSGVALSRIRPPRKSF